MLFLILVVLLLMVFWVYNSPFPISMIVRMMFKKGVTVIPENYNEILKQVAIERNISYQSKYKKGYFDLIYPKNQKSSLPIIIWVHGGGFVGGDKSDVEEYAVQVASNGYIIANINYALSPEVKYPTQIYQLAEVFQFLTMNADEYNLDMSRVFFAGDSAGAHIVSQFALIQINKQYANMLNIKKVMDFRNIRGMLLFCGLYDVKEFLNISDNAFIKFVVRQIIWGYTGIRNLAGNGILQELSVMDYVNKDFPATFITDGNKYTFTQQGINFVDELEAIDIDVTSVFYDTQEKIIHEYQFMMNNEYSYHTYQKVIQFLKNESK